MTPLMVQQALIDELKEMFKGYEYKNAKGEMVPLNVYMQDTPVQKYVTPEYNEESETVDTYEEDEESEVPVPYIIVRLKSGGHTGNYEDPNVINIVLIVCIWDDGLENEGHVSVMNILQKIYERFAKNSDLRRIAVFNGQWVWARQEDDYYPFFIGSSSLSFNIPYIRKETYYGDYC